MKILAPAKINLFLHVTGHRSDGYHLLSSLMCPVALYDTLNIEPNDSGAWQIECDHPQLADGDENIALRAARLYVGRLTPRHAAGISGGHIVLGKRIPIGAGLGGGSSDAAAVLVGLNRRCAQPLSGSELKALAVELGADVPFFIDAKPALAQGIGEQLTPISMIKPYHLVIVYPGVVASTAEVYKNLNLRLTKCQKQLRYFHFGSQEFDASQHLCNDLEAVAMQWFPQISDAKTALIDQGACGAMMTGSGSAVFGLFMNETSAVRAQRKLARHHRGWQIFKTHLMI